MNAREKLKKELPDFGYLTPNQKNLIADFILADRARIVNLIKNKGYNDKCKCKSCRSITEELKLSGV